MQPKRTGLSASTQGMTEMQAAFVRHVAAGKEAPRAAELAGYASPEVAGYRLLRDPRIIAALEPEFDRLEIVDLVPAAYAALRRAMRPEMPIGMQVKAADIVLRHRKGKQGAGSEADALSEAELEATIERLKKEAAALDARRPPMIDVTPSSSGGDGLFD